MAEGKPGWGEERSLTVRWNDPTTAKFDGEPMAGIDYLYGLRDGDFPTAPVVKAGRRVTFTEAKVTDSKGRLIATATSSLLIVPPAG